MEHVSKDGEVLWRGENLKNVLHTEGEQYLLEGAFMGGSVDTFYFGLDSRLVLSASDTMSLISAEPTTNGYARQTVDENGWVAIINIGGFNEIGSDIFTYSASGGDWGPVKNVFLTTEIGAGGLLISSVPLGSDISVTDGSSFSIRMNLSLRDLEL